MASRLDAPEVIRPRPAIDEAFDQDLASGRRVAEPAHDLIGAGTTMQAPPLLRPGAVVSVFCTLVAVGLASGILPALRATRIDPAVALRGA